MRPEVVALLWDAHAAATAGVAFVAGRTFAEYLADPMLSAAVERKLEIVGEAFGRLRKLDAALADATRGSGRVDVRTA